LRRLSGVTAVVWHGSPDRRVAEAAHHLSQFDMRLVGDRFVAVTGAQRSCDASFLKGRKLHAIAGIGDPRRFFRQLEALGLECEEHPFPDHHSYTRADLAFARGGVLLMTEKDAVKCGPLAPGEAWVLPVEALIGAPPGHAGLFETILEKLNGRPPA
jgi:tetraacyldisaccharide 4'-kinase